MIRCIIFLFLFVSCSIFRKSTSDYSYRSGRDSVGISERTVDLSRLIVVDGSEVLYELDASGFRVIRVGSDGRIEAEGENGQLNVRRKERSDKTLEKVDSMARNSEVAAVKDSTRVDESKDRVYDADPDTWFNWWWVFVAGVGLVVVAWLFIRKFDFKKWFKW